jgi:hypothetical protein
MSKKRQYLVKDTNKVAEEAKEKIFFEELKGEPLSNVIEYWCMVNGKDFLGSPPVGFRTEENLKAIEDKISELNTLLNE